jgi:menaquinone-dependent protoporphyrinogen oxidase
MGSWLPEARSFAERHRAALAPLPVWLFSSGPLGAPDPQPPTDRRLLAAPLGGVTVRDHQIFVGKLDPAGLGLGERLAAKVVHAPAGDFRDWAAIHAWAKTIAQALRAESAAKEVPV